MPLTPHLMAIEPIDPPQSCECGRAAVAAIVAFETYFGPLAVSRIVVCMACARGETWTTESS